MIWTQWTFFGFVMGGISLSYVLLVVALNVEHIAANLRKRRLVGLSFSHR